jgi:hypothetical protein
MRSPVIAAVCVAFLLLFLSACSPTETGGLRSPSPSPSVAYIYPCAGCGEPPLVLPTGSPVVTGDVCSLADRSAVEALIGPLRTQPTNFESDALGPRVWPIDLPLPGVIGSGCAYRSNEGALDVTFGWGALGRTEFETGVRRVPGGATAVSGAGDVAYSIHVDLPFRAAGAATIVVLDGSTYFTVEARSITKSSDALLSSITDLAKRIADRVYASRR